MCTTTSCTALGATPSAAHIAVPTSAADTSGVSGDAACTNSTVVDATHSDKPPHTPQLSTPDLQHSPDAVNAVSQQVPAASTATPDPPHTPHTSTRDAQHRPSPSTAVTPASQHCPVSLSTKPSQHDPSHDTMPSSHGTRPPVDAPPAPPNVLVDENVITSQRVPAHPGLHTHDEDKHIMLTPAKLQSSSSKHPHGRPMSHNSRTTGLCPDPAFSHSASGCAEVAVDDPSVHVTSRCREPCPHPATPSHGDHAPTRHTRTASGHSCVLHPRSVAGACSLAASHSDVDTSTPSRRHGAADRVDTPDAPPSVATHGAEHAVQRPGEPKCTAGHACVLHSRCDGGAAASSQRVDNKPLASKHRTERTCSPPAPHGCEHGDHAPAVHTAAGGERDADTDGDRVGGVEADEVGEDEPEWGGDCDADVVEDDAGKWNDDDGDFEGLLEAESKAGLVADVVADDVTAPVVDGNGALVDDDGNSGVGDDDDDWLGNAVTDADGDSLTVGVRDPDDDSLTVGVRDDDDDSLGDAVTDADDD